MAKYLDYVGLSYYTRKVSNLIDTKVNAALVGGLKYIGPVQGIANMTNATIDTTVTPNLGKGFTIAAKQGDVFVVSVAGLLDGISVEVGDMLLCKADVAAATSSTYTTVAASWDFIEKNDDGIVTGPSSAVDSHVAVFNSTTGKVIKDSGYTIAASVPSGAKFTDTTSALYVGASGASANSALLSPYLVLKESTGTSYNIQLTSGSLTGSVGADLTINSTADGKIKINHLNRVTAAGNVGPTANATVSLGSTLNVPYLTYDIAGHITSATNRVMTLGNYTLPVLSPTVLGGAKTCKANSVTATVTVPAVGTDAISIEAPVNTGLYYGVQNDAVGRLFTNIPKASSTSFGIVKSGSDVTTVNSNYAAIPIIDGIPYYLNSNKVLTLSAGNAIGSTTQFASYTPCTANTAASFVTLNTDSTGTASTDRLVQLAADSNNSAVIIQTEAILQTEIDTIFSSL